MKTFIKYCIISVLVLTSCSSPESDGKNAAKDFCENIDLYVKKKSQAYLNFIKEFDNENYQSRVKARDDLNKKIDAIAAEYNSTIRQLEGKYNALLEKYMDDHERIIELVSAYRSIVDEHSVDSTMFATLKRQANAKILTIIPPQPDKEKLESDLVGRKVYAIPGGYFADSWVWTIAPGEIKTLQIREQKDVDAHNKEYLIEMTLQASGAAYKTTGKVFYKLDEGDDWEIDLLEPSEVEIVKTGKYDNCITSQLSKYFVGTFLILRNHSDGALLVGYSILGSDGEWEKHSVIVRGGGTAQLSYLALEDCTIDFVERP